MLYFATKKNFLFTLQSVKDEREGGAEDVQQSQPCNHPVEDGRGSGQVGYPLNRLCACALFYSGYSVAYLCDCCISISKRLFVL